MTIKIIDWNKMIEIIEIIEQKTLNMTIVEN